MLNIQFFVDRRHQLGFSQQELCAGICTQSTLSKFENNGKVPATKILIQLCERLDLTLADLFTANNQNQTYQKQLEDAEFQLITTEFDKIAATLDSIDMDKLTDLNDQMAYHYLKGFLFALDKFKPLDSLFEFNNVFDLDPSATSIYTQLAYAGCGLVYSKRGQNTQAEYYFDKVLHQIYEIQVKDNRTSGQVAGLVYYSADFYAQKEDYETSNQLLEYGYRIGTKYHVTYYIARMLFRRGVNGYTTHDDPEKVSDWLNQAEVFARFNLNDNLLKEIRDFRNTKHPAQ